MGRCRRGSGPAGYVGETPPVRRGDRKGANGHLVWLRPDELVAHNGVG